MVARQILTTEYTEAVEPILKGTERGSEGLGGVRGLPEAGAFGTEQIWPSTAWPSTLNGRKCTEDERSESEGTFERSEK